MRGPLPHPVASEIHLRLPIESSSPPRFQTLLAPGAQPARARGPRLSTKFPGRHYLGGTRLVQNSHFSTKFFASPGGRSRNNVTAPYVATIGPDHISSGRRTLHQFGAMPLDPFKAWVTQKAFTGFFRPATVEERDEVHKLWFQLKGWHPERVNDNNEIELQLTWTKMYSDVWWTLVWD